MIVTFSRSLWYECLPVGSKGLENQLMRKKKLFALATKLCFIEYKQYAKDSREKEGYCQRCILFCTVIEISFDVKVCKTKCPM